MIADANGDVFLGCWGHKTDWSHRGHALRGWQLVIIAGIVTAYTRSIWLSRDGVVTVDFKAGNATRGDVSLKLARAIRRYREVLPEFCAKHGASVQAFTELSVDYYGVVKRRGVVTVKDRNGHQSVDEHVGSRRKRIKFMDRLGRIRTWRRK